MLSKLKIVLIVPINCRPLVSLDLQVQQIWMGYSLAKSMYRGKGKNLPEPSLSTFFSFSKQGCLGALAEFLLITVPSKISPLKYHAPISCPWVLSGLEILKLYSRPQLSKIE